MAPTAPPLTREEFVSLRDGAKGLMHRIPSEHKARADRARIHRGSFWRHSIDERWQDEDCGRLTDLKWPRPYFRCKICRPGVGRNPQAARLLKRPQHRNKSRHGCARLHVQSVLRHDYDLMAD